MTLHTLSKGHHHGAITGRIIGHVAGQNAPSVCIGQKRAPGLAQRLASHRRNEFNVQFCMVQMRERKGTLSMTGSGLIQPVERLGSVGSTPSPTGGDHVGRGETRANPVKGSLTYGRHPLLCTLLSIQSIDCRCAFGLGSSVVDLQGYVEQLHGRLWDTRSAVPACGHSVKQPQIATS